MSWSIAIEVVVPPWGHGARSLKESVAKRGGGGWGGGGGGVGGVGGWVGWGGTSAPPIYVPSSLVSPGFPRPGFISQRVSAEGLGTMATGAHGLSTHVIFSGLLIFVISLFQHIYGSSIKN